MQPATPPSGTPLYQLSEPFFSRIANSVWGFSQRYWRLVVVAMLALLHIAVFRGVADPWARALLPAEAQPPEASQIIDFFYSVFLMLLLVVVILGSFTFMTLTRSSYLDALTRTVFLTAAGMLLIGLAWNPRSGGGLGVFFARYLFSIGLPVQRSLHVLAVLLQVEARPERFLADAIAALARLPAGSGVEWRRGGA